MPDDQRLYCTVRCDGDWVLRVNAVITAEGGTCNAFRPSNGRVPATLEAHVTEAVIAALLRLEGVRAVTRHEVH